MRDLTIFRSGLFCRGCGMVTVHRVAYFLERLGGKPWFFHSLAKGASTTTDLPAIASRSGEAGGSETECFFSAYEGRRNKP